MNYLTLLSNIIDDIQEGGFKNVVHPHLNQLCTIFEHRDIESILKEDEKEVSAFEQAQEERIKNTINTTKLMLQEKDFQDWLGIQESTAHHKENMERFQHEVFYNLGRVGTECWYENQSIHFKIPLDRGLYTSPYYKNKTPLSQEEEQELNHMECAKLKEHGFTFDDNAFLIANGTNEQLIRQLYESHFTGIQYIECIQQVGIMDSVHIVLQLDYECKQNYLDKNTLEENLQKTQNKPGIFSKIDIQNIQKAITDCQAVVSISNQFLYTEQYKNKIHSYQVPIYVIQTLYTISKIAEYESSFIRKIEQINKCQKEEWQNLRLEQQQLLNTLQLPKGESICQLERHIIEHLYLLYGLQTKVRIKQNCIQLYFSGCISYGLYRLHTMLHTPHEEHFSKAIKKVTSSLPDIIDSSSMEKLDKDTPIRTSVLRILLSPTNLSGFQKIAKELGGQLKKIESNEYYNQMYVEEFIIEIPTIYELLKNIKQ